MKKYDTMTIGHISLDYNIDYLDNQIVEVGGAVIYSSAAAYAGGYKVAAVTKLAQQDMDRLSELSRQHVHTQQVSHRRQGEAHLHLLGASRPLPN